VVGLGNFNNDSMTDMVLIRAHRRGSTVRPGNDLTYHFPLICARDPASSTARRQAVMMTALPDSIELVTATTTKAFSHAPSAERAAKENSQSISATKMSLAPPTGPTHPQ
jgi:hypothetical protein